MGAPLRELIHSDGEWVHTEYSRPENKDPPEQLVDYHANVLDRRETYDISIGKILEPYVNRLAVNGDDSTYKVHVV